MSFAPPDTSRKEYDRQRRTWKTSVFHVVYGPRGDIPRPFPDYDRWVSDTLIAHVTPFITGKANHG